MPCPRCGKKQKRRSPRGTAPVNANVLYGVACFVAVQGMDMASPSPPRGGIVIVPVIVAGVVPAAETTPL
jgi:hypothetical protein